MGKNLKVRRDGRFGRRCRNRWSEDSEQCVRMGAREQAERFPVA